MLPIVNGPLPDWGLCCPGCQAELAGVTEEHCPQCGRAFSLLQVLSLHRPIPDVGVSCPQCGYSLTGLMESTCPECGESFALRELLELLPGPAEPPAVPWADPPDHRLPRRPPIYTGEERPLPDFGFCCPECGGSLAGAMDDACPNCRTLFELPGPEADWEIIDESIPFMVRHFVRLVLYEAQVPYLLENAQLRALYGGTIVPFLPGHLRVPREYYFDALFAMYEAARPKLRHAGQEWTCPKCEEKVPDGFEICWNCGHAHPELAETDEA